MPLLLPKSAAALIPLLLATTLWLPSARHAQASIASMEGTVAATYALPLAA